MQRIILKKLFLLFVLIIKYTPTYAENIVEKFIHNKHEVECLTKVIYFGARGEPVEGQMAVAWVTLNRTRHKKFPNTVCGVVYQPGQYSWVDNKKYKIHDWTLYFRLEKLAKYVMSAYNNEIVPIQIKHIKDALFFDSLALNHARGGVKIGNHNFYNSLSVKRQNEAQRKNSH